MHIEKRAPKKRKEAVQKDWSKKSNLKIERVSYTADILVDSEFGILGAIAITNKHQKEFFLETITIEGFACGPVHFPCNSWVQSTKDHSKIPLYEQHNKENQDLEVIELAWDLESALKSINLEDDEVKRLGLSCSFKIQDSIPSAMQLMGSQEMKIERSVSFKVSLDKHVEKTEMPSESLRSENVLEDLELGNPKHETVTKLQKAYKSFRTRRKLADCAVLIEQSWWKLLDFAELKRSSISYLINNKPPFPVGLE